MKNTTALVGDTVEFDRAGEQIKGKIVEQSALIGELMTFVRFSLITNGKANEVTVQLTPDDLISRRVRVVEPAIIAPLKYQVGDIIELQDYRHSGSAYATVVRAKSVGYEPLYTLSVTVGDYHDQFDTNQTLLQQIHNPRMISPVAENERMSRIKRLINGAYNRVIADSVVMQAIQASAFNVHDLYSYFSRDSDRNFWALLWIEYAFNAFEVNWDYRATLHSTRYTETARVGDVIHDTDYNKYQIIGFSVDEDYNLSIETMKVYFNDDSEMYPTGTRKQILLGNNNGLLIGYRLAAKLMEGITYGV